MQKFPGQGWSPSHSSDSARSLTVRPPWNLCVCVCVCVCERGRGREIERLKSENNEHPGHLYPGPVCNKPKRADKLKQTSSSDFKSVIRDKTGHDGGGG